MGIDIRWDGGARSLAVGDRATIGRDPTNDIVLTDPNVSRRHAVVEHDGTTWVVRDLGSSQGTHVDGRPVATVSVTDAMRVVLGRPGLGVPIDLDVGRASTASEAVDPATVVVATAGSTDAPGGPRQGRPGARPGGSLREEAFGVGTIVAGPTLRVECAGRVVTLSPGRTYAVGRDEAADVVSTNPTVSRAHAILRHDGAGWHVDDAGSSGGIHVDGRRVRTHPLVGTTVVWLGDPDAGERLVAVASGRRRPTLDARVRRLARRPALLAGLAVGLVVLVLAVSPGGSTGPDLDDLARGVVYIQLPDGSGGSGTIVDADAGLILTNAHVVAPYAPGQPITEAVGVSDVEPDDARTSRSIIAVTPARDRPVEVRFVAEVVAVDGYLDLAVVRIVGAVEGGTEVRGIRPGDLSDLVEVPLGPSDELESGDPLWVLGFPSAAATDIATLSTGVVSGFAADPRASAERGYVNVDAAIRAGNSGGLAADERGRIVAVPTLVRQSRSSDVPVSVLRPIALARDLLAAARNGTTYASPFVTDPIGTERIDAVAFTVETNDFVATTCAAQGSVPASGVTVVHLAVTYAGFAAIGHQDLTVRLVGPDGRVVGYNPTALSWPVPFGAAGCLQMAVPVPGRLAPGSYEIQFLVGPVSRRMDQSFTFTVA